MKAGNAGRPRWQSFVTRTGCYAEVMTLTLHLDDAVAAALAAEAERRGLSVDELAAALLAAQLPKPATVHRRLAFAAVGASNSGRGAAEADEMLAEGFGRD